MAVIDAKQARPVDDEAALVPFGWAPGGYYCAACSDCGQSHSGSDKRSVRCQDCAEALRDKPAHQPPMTAVDHAELKRLAVSMSDPEIDGYKMPGKTANVWAARLHALIADSEAKDAEIEGLKAERDHWRSRSEAGDRIIAQQSACADEQAALRTQAPDSWRPIETAPKDGTNFLVRRETGDVVVAYRHSPSSRTDEILSVPGAWTQSATHWMPLPAAPALRPQTAESGT